MPFFRGKHPQFISMLVQHLKLEFCAPGEYVVRKGDIGSEMYFVAEGLLEVQNPVDGVKKKRPQNSLQSSDLDPADQVSGDTLVDSSWGGTTWDRRGATGYK